MPRVLACCGGMITPTGAERMTFEVLGALREQGAAVHCILSGWGSREIEPMAERIGASWSAGGSHVKLDRHTRHPLTILRQIWDVVVTSAHLVREVVRFRPTHVLVPEHGAVIRSYPALLILRLLGVPCVMRLCNAPVETPFYRKLWKRVIDRVVSHYVCNSRFTQQELLACGIDRAKTSLIFNIVPRRMPAPQAESRDPHRVIFVGQVIPPKGLHVLLDAVGLLVGQGIDVSLDVVGRIDGWISPSYGDYWVRLKERVAAPDLAGRVRLLGWREDVDALMRASALHACPSLPEQRESFGLVVIEAKAAGLPSVVLPSGALGEQIAHGVDGWICPAATPEALAEGLAYFLTDRERLTRAGEAAERSSATYDRSLFNASWNAVFLGSRNGAILAATRSQLR